MTTSNQKLTTINPAPRGADPALITPKAFNAFLEAAKASGAIGSPGGGGGVIVDGTGTYQRPTRADADFYAILVDEGPAGEPDYEDWRYWFREVVPNPDYDPAADVASFGDWTETVWPFTLSTAGLWATLINMGESSIAFQIGGDSGNWRIGTHGLALLPKDIGIGGPLLDNMTTESDRGGVTSFTGTDPNNGLRAWETDTEQATVNNQKMIELPTLVKVTRFGHLYKIDRHPEKLTPKWDAIIQNVVEESHCPCKWQYMLNVGGNPVRMDTVDAAPPRIEAGDNTQECTDGLGIDIPNTP